MSFSINFPKSFKADFPAVVDATVEAPVQTTPRGKALVATLKAAAKSIAEQYDGDFPIQGYISGHVCEEMPGSSEYDTASVSVVEVPA